MTTKLEGFQLSYPPKNGVEIVVDGLKGWEDFGSDYMLPRQFLARFLKGRDFPYLPYDITLEIVFEKGRLTPEAFMARRSKRGPVLNLQHLREVPIGYLVGRAGEAALHRAHGDQTEPADWPDLRHLAAEGPTPQVLKHVGLIYRLAFAAGLPPMQEVIERLGVSRATAGRWIQAARTQKLIPPLKKSTRKGS